MNKDQAIKWYREITSGAGVDRFAPLVVIDRGDVALGLWNDGAFTLGIEYGVLIALVKAFGITREDLMGE